MDRSNIHALRWDIYTKDKEELIKRDSFWWPFRILKGGTLFGLVRRIISPRKIMTKKLSDKTALIINYLRKRRGGGFNRDYTGIII